MNRNNQKLTVKLPRKILCSREKQQTSSARYVVARKRSYKRTDFRPNRYRLRLIFPNFLLTTTIFLSCLNNFLSLLFFTKIQYNILTYLKVKNYMPNSLNDIKIYHIIHIDRFRSVLSKKYLYCDSIMSQKTNSGSIIGLNNIKQRRLETSLSSFPDLTVGQCVPFYFCPRSVMLYVISLKNYPGLQYNDGQDNIIHLVYNLIDVLTWANNNNLRTCYTTSNAGSLYFNDYSNFSQILTKIDWNSVYTNKWDNKEIKEKKQSEFLIENRISISLLKNVGVYNNQVYDEAIRLLKNYNISSVVEQRKDWYY